MRIGLNFRNKHTIKKDSRLLKSNYGFRPNYLIETAILQKYLICDNSKLTNQTIAHNMTDLEACYDQ